MALAINDIIAAMESHALATGYFQSVNAHESKQQPVSGLTCSIWVEVIKPVKTSGLANTSVRLQFEVRMYADTMSQPYDDIETTLVTALDVLMAAYMGDFTLGGLVRHVDVFGAHGPALEGRTGYINMDGRELRVFSINVPLIVDDLWPQTP